MTTKQKKAKERMSKTDLINLVIDSVEIDMSRRLNMIDTINNIDDYKRAFPMVIGELEAAARKAERWIVSANSSIEKLKEAL